MSFRNKRKIAIYVLIAAICTTTVAYAILQTTLNITGSVTKKGGRWSIYFENVSNIVKTGAATMTKPEIGSNGTSLDAYISLEDSLDSVSFTVDVKNAGTIDAELYSIVFTGLQDAYKQDISYLLTYNDGTAIKEGDILKSDEVKTIKVYVQHDDVDYISSTDVKLNLGFSLLYQQIDKNNVPSTPVDPTVCRVTKGIGLSLGDEITCGTESFYVFSTTDTHINMLAKHLLNVGDYKVAGQEGIQNSSLIELGTKKIIGGTVAFDSKNRKEYQGSTIQGYVDTYVNYLKTNVGVGDSTTGRLLYYDEVKAMATISSYNNITITESPEWLIDSRYWIDGQSSTHAYYIFPTTDGKNGVVTKNSYSDFRTSYGVRPVISILKTEI